LRAEINVTPLVDIVLVLLIIFIVITPAVSRAVRLPVARHGIRAPGDPDARPLTLVLPARPGAEGAEAGAVAVEGAGGMAFDLATESGRRNLAAFLQGPQAGRPLSIKADRALPFKAVNQLLRLCREAGVAEAAVVTRADAERAAGSRHG
jgi:biopolymer transport protein ExbD